ncbi:unnamed protein product [Durusdinium trenchii]|uniref:Uncharacterized protein n=2 Tax=Durusdinium trenchii TaxID=1381693 RepID=A0ABP0MYX6_9DINO
MAPVASCGFAVHATKKGELPLKVEKRAKGKKVTIIGNVSGDATRLSRGLQTMLGVGGSVRQAERGSWSVEVQGDQVPRVTKALLDFQCLHGLSSSSLETARTLSESRRTDSVVDRTAATKFLAQTRSGASMSPEEERRRLLEQEAEFYGQFWESAISSGDFLDIFEVEVQELPPGQTTSPRRGKLEGPELNMALQTLGLLAECGKAVREFWQNSGMSLQQFRKMAMNPGARMVAEGPGRREVPTNLKSRQKLSDWRSGAARASYFSPAVSAIDSYERGKAAAPRSTVLTYPEEPSLKVEEDEEGWCRAMLSYSVPLPVPASGLSKEDTDQAAKKALRALESRLSEDFSGVERSIPGVTCFLDVSTFGLDLSISEGDFLQGQRREAGKALTPQDKDEMRLEKKLREILALKRRQVEGEKLEKLQAEKVQKRVELFQEVAELKLRRAEKELMLLFKKKQKGFQEAFWAAEAEEKDAKSANASAPFGVFNQERCDGPVTVSSDQVLAESAAPRWVGVPLHVPVKQGEVAAFTVEIMRGTAVRLGWAWPSAAMAPVGRDAEGFGFESSGQKVTKGHGEIYGEGFGAGDTIHCEAEREDGRLRIGFAHNSEPLGVAFDVRDQWPEQSLTAVVSGKNFKVQLISAEAMPLEEAPEPILQNYVSYDPPKLARVQRDFQAGGQENLLLWSGETVYVSANDGKGWLYGFFLDEEDPDDGGWFPVDAVSFLDEEEAAGEPSPQTEASAADPEPAEGWSAPAQVEEAWQDWTAAPPQEAPEAPPWGEAEAVEAVAEDCPVEGLEDWLLSISLHHYGPQAMEWCVEMGAVSIEEIKESWEDFAQDLRLKPLEKNRLRKACQ